MATDASLFVTNYKEYNDILETYVLRRRNQEKVWIENDLLPKLRDVFTQEDCTQKSEFKVLAVGSNVGSFDCLLIKALFSHAKELMQGKKVSYTVVEPNKAAIEEFKHSASLKDNDFQNVSFNWVNKSVQEILDAEESERFDLIHFAHVFYYIDNEEEILKSSYDKLLASPGCMFIVTGIEGDSIWIKLIESFKAKIPSLYLKQSSTNFLLSEICKRNTWSYDIFDAKVNLEVTEIFNASDPVGIAVLKFLFHTTEDPREKFGKELMSEILEFFERMSWEEMKDGKKCLFVNEGDGILLVYK